MKITAAAGSRKDSFRRTLSDRLYCNGACSVATTSDQGDLLQYQGKETQEALFALFGNTDKESNSENAVQACLEHFADCFETASVTDETLCKSFADMEKLVMRGNTGSDRPTYQISATALSFLENTTMTIAAVGNGAVLRIRDGKFEVLYGPDVMMPPLGTPPTTPQTTKEDGAPNVQEETTQQTQTDASHPDENNDDLSDVFHEDETQTHADEWSDTPAEDASFDFDAYVANSDTDSDSLSSFTPYLLTQEVMPGDIYIACSAPVTEALSPASMMRHIRSCKSSQEMVNAILSAAQDTGISGDLSALVVVAEGKHAAGAKGLSKQKKALLIAIPAAVVVLIVTLVLALTLNNGKISDITIENRSDLEQMTVGESVIVKIEPADVTYECIGTGDILSYDPETKTLTALKVGTVTISFKAPDSGMEQIEITVTEEKETTESTRATRHTTSSYNNIPDEDEDDDDEDETQATRRPTTATQATQPAQTEAPEVVVTEPTPTEPPAPIETTAPTQTQATQPTQPIQTEPPAETTASTAPPPQPTAEQTATVAQNAEVAE